MRIIFGMQLDGWRSNSGSLRFNELTCGPLGLLNQLELRLGLPPRLMSHARRVMAYRRALEQAMSSQERFYTKSFDRDPLAVAETLLGWRDDLVMAGWDGTPFERGSPRIKDLMEVEALANGEVRTGHGEGLSRVLRALEAGRNPMVDVDVIDPKQHLPGLQLRLLEKLGANFVARADFPLAVEGSNLRQAQEALLGRRETITWNGPGDDSVTVCTAFSEITLAQVAARWIGSEAPPNGRLLLTTTSGSAVAAALRGAGAPCPEALLVSKERPVAQVLPLALRLRWRPLNPQHLLEFLVHPVCPIPSRLRNRLAAAVAEQPGIGGPAWQEALEKATKEREHWQNEGDGSAADVLAAKMNDWLLIDRFDPGTGAPASTLIETCERVRLWARGRAAGDISELQAQQWSLLAAQALELTELLADSGVVTASELDRMLALVQGLGSTWGDAPAELGAIHCLDHPGAVLEPVSEVFWWCFESPPQMRTAPWTVGERQLLASMEVNLLAPDVLIEAQHAASLRPLLAATDRVRLFLPGKRVGESVNHHPLLDELCARASGPVPAMNVDEELRKTGRLSCVEQLRRRPLPALRRWWKLPRPELLAARPNESFTSIEKFVYQPFAWVLQHRARLVQGAVGVFSIQAESRQRGNLIHRVTERLFVPGASIDWRTTSEMEFKAWLEALWPELLETEGANLLLPGMRAAAESLNQETRRALWHLIVQLRAAGVREALADVKPAKATFRDGATLVGRIDLLVRRDVAPCTAVVDLKYGGKAKRQNELAQNIALQLAVYSYLHVSEHHSEWPQSAYFILGGSCLLAHDQSFFPQATALAPKASAQGSEACWKDFLGVWDWRRKQMSGGWIEVPLAETEPTDGLGTEPNSSPPDSRWTHDPKAQRYDDFMALTGWKEQA